MAAFLRLCGICVSLLIALSTPGVTDDSREDEGWKLNLSDLYFDADQDRDPTYDHEAFLGKGEVKTFDQLSQEEAKKRLRIIIKKIDVDRDRFVSEQELKDWVDYLHDKFIREDTDKHWADLSVDHDGKLTWPQYLLRAYGNDSEKELESRSDDFYKHRLRLEKRRWDKADQNRDSAIDRKEYLAFLHPEEVDHMKGIYVQEALENLDKDKDGFVSLEEYINDLHSPEDRKDGMDEPDWVNNERQRFSSYRDKNKDGKLDTSEVKSMIAPDNYNRAEAEAKHLIRQADINKDSKLSEDEIVKNFNIFVSSRVTHYGEALLRHEEL